MTSKSGVVEIHVEAKDVTEHDKVLPDLVVPGFGGDDELVEHLHLFFE